MKPYTIGLYEKAMPAELTWEEKLLAAKRAGYDFVEISVDETEDKLARLNWTAGERADLVQTMERCGIRFRTMCLSGHRKYPLGDPDEDVRKRSLEIMEKAVGLADDLGVRIIQLAGYDVYYKEGAQKTRELFEENLKKAVHMAAAKGILLGFETMETPFMDTVGKAMEYVRMCDSPYLGVYPDCGNLNNASLLYGHDLYEDIESGKGHIVALHVKETKPGLYRDMFYGEGCVNFEKVIDLAWRMGIRRYVTEFWYHEEQNSDNWEERLRAAASFVSVILDQKSDQK